MTDKERLEMIKHDFEECGKYGGFIDDIDTLWLIEQAEKVEELETALINCSRCIICGDNGSEVIKSTVYCSDCGVYAECE